MAQEPVVLSTSPSNYATKVSTTTPITAEFSIDIDRRHIEDYIYLTDAHGVRIEGRMVYRKRKVIFTPLKPLEPGTSYQFFLIGDSNLEDHKTEGIRNLMGTAMRGNKVINFTTEQLEALSPPVTRTPNANSIIRQTPTFSWDEVNGAAGYELRISKTNRYDSLFYSSDRINSTSIEPSVEWEDGLYYWSVRAFREDGVASEWSSSNQFNLSTSIEGPISEDDAPSVDILYEGLDTELEVVEQFPKDEDSDIPINTKSIFFRVIGDVDVSLIDVDSFKIVGKHITGDYEEESHGEVKGRYAIVRDDDGTTYIIFTPDPLPTEEDEEGQVE